MKRKKLILEDNIVFQQMSRHNLQWVLLWLPYGVVGGSPIDSPFNIGAGYAGGAANNKQID